MLNEEKGRLPNKFYLLTDCTKETIKKTATF